MNCNLMKQYITSKLVAMHPNAELQLFTYVVSVIRRRIRFLNITVTENHIMLIIFIVLGSLAFIGSVICAVTIKDWKPRCFLNLYADLLFLAASIGAKRTMFIVVFIIFAIFSVLTIVSHIKRKDNDSK